MKERESKNLDATESLIETLHATRRSKFLIINPDYLDAEKLRRKKRAAIFKGIFNQKIRENQISRIMS